MNTEILKLLTLPHCSIIRDKKGVIIDTPGNSLVHALGPSPNLFETITILVPSFTQFFSNFDKTISCKPEDFKFGINHVDINGPLEEELHVHISCIIAIIVFGKGTAIYEKNGQILREQVLEGDIIIVPQNAPHYFTGDDRLIYTGIEIGPVIDYQKHHKH